MNFPSSTSHALRAILCFGGLQLHGDRRHSIESSESSSELRRPIAVVSSITEMPEALWRSKQKNKRMRPYEQQKNNTKHEGHSRCQTRKTIPEDWRRVSCAHNRGHSGRKRSLDWARKTRPYWYRGIVKRLLFHALEPCPEKPFCKSTRHFVSELWASLGRDIARFLPSFFNLVLRLWKNTRAPCRVNCKDL